MSIAGAAARCLALLEMLLFASPAPAAPPASQPAADPMAWSAPPTLPPLRERLDRQQFDARFAAEDAQLDKTILNLPDPPLEKSDRYETATEWFPARAYANGGSRSPNWDSLMLAACRAWKDDPALAETSLLHAQKAGYHGWVLTALEARIALRELRFDDTLAYGSIALAQAPADRKPVIAAWVYTAAILDYKLQLAQQMAQQYPVAYDQAQLPMLKNQIALAQSCSHCLPTPADATADLFPPGAFGAGRAGAITAPNPFDPVDLTRSIRVVRIGGDAPDPSYPQALRGGATMNMESPTGRYALCAFGPPASNCLLRTHLKLVVSDQKQPIWDHCAAVELIDLQRPNFTVFKIYLVVNGSVSIDTPGGDETGLQLSPQTRWKPDGAELRLVLLGQDCEVTLDGRRVFYGAVGGDQKTRRIVFALQASGTRTEFTHLKWVRLRPPDHG